MTSMAKDVGKSNTFFDTAALSRVEREIFLRRGKLSRILVLGREHLKHKKGPDTDETPGKTVPRPILFQRNKL